MDFYKNLKMAQRESGLTIVEIANLLGVPRPTVSSWFNDPKRTPPPNRIVDIARILGTTEQALINPAGISVRKVPIMASTSCGDATTNDYQDSNEYAYYNGKHWTPDLYCVIACGDSMSPEIEDGDEIICDPKAEIQSGDMVHYRIGDESAVKIYVRDEEAYIVQFIPYNSNENFKTRTIRLDDDEANEVKISKVVAVNKLKFNNRKSRLKLIGWA